MSYKFLLSLFALLLLFPVCSTQAQENLSQKFSGRILLQVEQNGEAWYINPEDKKKHSLGRPADAFQVMREQGVGISGQNLSKIQPAVDNLTGDDSDGDGLPDAFEEAVGTDPEASDTDGDGYSDQEELQNGYNPQGTGKLDTDNNFVQKHQGKILLQVEDQGQAWYVNPENNKRYFLGRPGDAFEVMRELGLGISDEDFNKLSEADSGQDQNNSQAIGDCQSFPEKLEVCEPFTCEFDHPLTGEKMQREIKGLEDDKCVYIEEMPNDGKMECNYTEDYYQAVAQYYRDTYKADSFGTEVEDGETTHTIDGKEVENPVQEAMDQGQCVVSEGQKEEQGEEDEEQETAEKEGCEHGKEVGGGVVAECNDQGEPTLIAMKQDIAESAEWGCEEKEIGADSESDGEYNTQKIIENCQEEDIAARLCAESAEGGYEDWYLPSKEELDLLYNNKDKIGGFSSDFYWSSPEYSSDFAWGQYFDNGNQHYNFKSNVYRVRCLRSF